MERKGSRSERVAPNGLERERPNGAKNLTRAAIPVMKSERSGRRGEQATRAHRCLELLAATDAVLPESFDEIARHVRETRRRRRKRGNRFACRRPRTKTRHYG